MLAAVDARVADIMRRGAEKLVKYRYCHCDRLMAEISPGVWECPTHKEET